MGLVDKEDLGPFRRDFDAERVCEVLVDTLQRTFPNNSTTQLQIHIIPYIDSIICDLLLGHNRGSGWKMGKLELAFTDQPLGVYVRVGRSEVTESLTDQLILVVKATADGELAPTSMTSRKAASGASRTSTGSSEKAPIWMKNEKPVTPDEFKLLVEQGAINLDTNSDARALFEWYRAYSDEEGMPTLNITDFAGMFTSHGRPLNYETLYYRAYRAQPRKSKKKP